jgi:hypothetical protein
VVCDEVELLRRSERGKPDPANKDEYAAPSHLLSIAVNRCQSLSPAVASFEAFDFVCNKDEYAAPGHLLWP